MKAFAYRATQPSGQVRTGRLNAHNENELAHILSNKGLELIEARETRAQNTSQKRHGKTRRATRDLIETLCQQLADLLKAGVPLAQAIAWIGEAMTLPSLKDQLIGIEHALRAGDGLANAFAAQPALSDPVFLSILTAGEKSGDLPGTFETLATHIRATNAARRLLIKALRYPAFLLAVAIGVTSFMMAWVVPQIVAFLDGLGIALPFMTKLLLGAAQAFAIAWWVTPAFALLISLAVVLARHHDNRFTILSDGWLLALPGLGNVLRKLALSRFTGSLALLLQGGVSLPEALSVARTTLGNAHLSRDADTAHQGVLNGQALSEAASCLFPPFLLQLVKIGEKTGALPITFQHMARISERDARDALNSFLGLLEPLLTLLIGGLLAWIVLAVLGPVYGALGPLAQGI